jgi:hypothetical protein
LYVWQRIKITDENGDVYYEDPTYAKDITQSLINSCILDILLADADNDGFSATWEKNLAATTTSVPLQFIAYSRSYRSSSAFKSAITSILIKFFKNGEELDPSTEIDLTSATPVEGFDNDLKTASLTYSATFTKALDADSLSITVKIQDSYLKADGTSYTRDTMATKTMNAVDATEYYAYGGVLPNVNNDDAEAIAYFNSNNGGVYQGFNYVDSTHNTIRYYNGSQWDVLTLSENHAGTILSNVESDFWSLFQNTSDTDKANLWDLYGYKKEIIASAMATSKLIMYGQGVIASANISTDPAEDIDAKGFLTKPGYRFEGANGITRARTGYFSDIEIGGNANIGADTNILGEIHNIEEGTDEVTFETIRKEGQSATYTAVTKEDGVSVPDAVDNAEWYNYVESWVNANLADKTTYDVLSSCFSNANDLFRYIVRISSLSSISDSKSYTTSETVVFTNPYPFALTSGFTYTLTERVLDIFLAYRHSGCTIRVYTSSGSVYYTNSLSYVEDKNSAARSMSGSNLLIPSLGYVTVQWGSVSGSTAIVSSGSFSFTFDESIPISNTGIYFVQNMNNPGSSTRYLLSDIQSQSGFWTFPSSRELHLYVNGFSEIRAAKSAASWPTGVNKYYSFAWNNGPSNVSVLSTSMLGGGTVFNYAGSNILPVLVRYSSTYLELQDSQGNIYAMTSGYVREYEITLVIVPGYKGARAQNLMPVFENGSRVGSGNVGTQTESWYIGWAASGWQQGSKREWKENILPLDKDALAIINSVDVVSYNLKADRAREDERYTHYGFIADDTAEELASPFHDRMDYGSCIGILIKAIQELSAEIDRLKGGNN